MAIEAKNKRLITCQRQTTEIGEKRHIAEALFRLLTRFDGNVLGSGHLINKKTNFCPKSPIKRDRCT